MVALFTITKIQRQPKCPWTEEWIRKMWYLYAMEYYSARKKENIGSMVFDISVRNIFVSMSPQARETKQK